ncbi:MAG: hypothetical protein AB8G11_16735 [Saprospiraceae bacterium]
MSQVVFRTIGFKTENHLVLMAVVPKDMLGDVPNVFSCNTIKVANTIYTGTYPTLKVDIDSIKINQ